MAIDGEGGTPDRRPIWLVLRGDAPAFGSEDLARAGTRVRILADPAGIADLLRRERPRLAIVDGPAPGAGNGSTGPGTLGARLEALAAENKLDAREAIEDGILPIAGRFELDVFAHELREGPRVVHLRPKEFQLLATFAANPGIAFSREQLIDLVWSRNPAVDHRTVDVHVHALRAKIEPEPQRPVHLVTVRGFGYRLDGSRR